VNREVGYAYLLCGAEIRTLTATMTEAFGAGTIPYYMDPVSFYITDPKINEPPNPVHTKGAGIAYGYWKFFNWLFF